VAYIVEIYLPRYHIAKRNSDHDNECNDQGFSFAGTPAPDVTVQKIPKQQVEKDKYKKQNTDHFNTTRVIV
jgi:hypothetical protein